MQLLVLVLAAQIHRGSHRARQLADAGHAAVHGHARAAVGAHASRGDQLRVLAVARIFQGSDAEKAARHDERVLAVAHRPLVGALPHEQLQCGKERGLAGTGLAGEHGQATCRLQRRLADQRQVFHLDLIDHRAPLAAPAFGTIQYTSSPPSEKVASWQYVTAGTRLSA